MTQLIGWGGLMIILKSDRTTSHISPDFREELEQSMWYCSQCDTEIEGTSNNLVYLGEEDRVFHLHFNLQGLKDIHVSFRDVPLYKQQKLRETQHFIDNFVSKTPSSEIEGIPKEQFIKLLKNAEIKSDKNTAKIRERDNNTCQLCGFDDYRALQVHHIIPKINPFFDTDLIRDPINCITLCANCHRISHYIYMNGTDSEREKLVKSLLKLNGFNLRWTDWLMWDSMESYRKWRSFK